MKKVMKKLAVVMAAMVMVLAFTACGGEDMSSSPYLGKWVAETAEYSGIEMSVEDIFGSEVSFTLEDDGTCTAVIDGEEESGKWTETDQGFNVEDEFDFVVDGDNASLDYDGVTLNLVRQ